MAEFHLTVLLAVLLSCTTTSTVATVYTVGNTAGWDISSALSSWPAGKTFYVGDVLLFRYSSYHSLHQVDKAGYANCSTSHQVISSNNGNTTVPLTSPGDKYFICGVLLHCLSGMRLRVNVVQRTVLAPASAPAQEPSRPADDGPPAKKGGGSGFYLSGAPTRFGTMRWSSVVMFSFWLLGSFVS